METAASPTGDAQRELREFIAGQMEAIRAKNLDAIMAPYAGDAVVFDVKPPFRTVGAVAWRAVWAACMPHFPVGVHMESRELTVRTSGDMGFAHWLCGFTMSLNGEPEQTIWMRATVCCRRAGGRWQIEHEHWSSPYDPTTGRVVLELE